MRDLDILIAKLQKSITKKSSFLKTMKDPHLLVRSLIELRDITGMEKIKDSIALQIVHLIISKKRSINQKKDGIMLNALLCGPPGCGKTTCGTILAKIWYSLGYLKGSDRESRSALQDMLKMNNNDEDMTIMFIAFVLIALLWMIGITWNFYNSYGPMFAGILVVTFIVIAGVVIWMANSKSKPASKPNGITNYLSNNDDYIKIVSRVDFVGAYVGSTAIKTTKLLEDSLGKVLFVDEAYSILQSVDDSFGMEALTTLNLFMSEHPNEIIVIFAGYKDLLESGPFAAQPGLKRRFMWHFDIDGYSTDELYKIFKHKINKEKWTLSDDGETYKIFERNGTSFPNYGGDIERLLYFSDIERSKDSLYNKNVDIYSLTPSQIDKGMSRLNDNNIDSSKSSSTQTSTNPMANMMNMFRNRNNTQSMDQFSSDLSSMYNTKTSV